MHSHDDLDLLEATVWLSITSCSADELTGGEDLGHTAARRVVSLVFRERLVCAPDQNSEAGSW